MEISIATLKKERSWLERMSFAPEELHFDASRARELFGRILERYLHDLRRRTIRKEDLAPQWRHRPRAIAVGSDAHRRWLFSSAATDVRGDSNRVYETHRRLFENDRLALPFHDLRSTRELYEAEVLSWTDDDLRHGLAKCQFGNPRRNVDGGWWKTRARTLWETWDGDPFRMFAGGTVDAVVAFKKANGANPLPGIGPKVASLIGIYFEEIGHAPIPDAFPIDVHVQRIALALRVVIPLRPAPILNETLEQLLRPRLAALCAEESWDRIDLSHALWGRGNHLCTGCWRDPNAIMGCEVFRECQGAYWSRPYFQMGLWLPELGPMAKGGCAPMVPFLERPLFFHQGNHVGE